MGNRVANREDTFCDFLPTGRVILNCQKMGCALPSPVVFNGSLNKNMIWFRVNFMAIIQPLVVERL